MGADLIARGFAAAVRDRALAVLPDFADLASRAISAAADRIEAGVGEARGLYVADTFATAQLAAAHPQFCKADAAGRHFRLLPSNGAISVEQGGATGTPGVNDQPAIQATIAYAATAGIGQVLLTRPAYELWAPVRTSAGGVVAMDGTPLNLIADIHLLAPRRAVLSFKGPTGGNRDDDYQTFKGSPWRGGGIQLFGDQYPWSENPDEWGLQEVTIENIELDGGCDVGGKVATSTDTSDKGIFFHNTGARRLRLKNVTVRRFHHELLYGGNYINPENEYYLEGVKALSSGHSCLNLTWGKHLLDVGGEYGDAYQAAEQFGGDQVFVGTKFHSSGAVVLCSSVPPHPSDAGYTYPGYPGHMQNTRLIGVRCEDIDGPGTQIGAYVQGDLTMVDSYAVLMGTAMNIDLKITAVLDQFDGYTAMVFAGPAALPSGISEDLLPRHINIDLTAKVTQQAEDEGRGWGAVYALGGYLDPETCTLTIRYAECYNIWKQAYGTLRAMPRVRCLANRTVAEHTGLVPGAPGLGGNGAALSLDPAQCGATVYADYAPAAVPTATACSFAAVGAGGDYEGIPHGQTFKVFHGGGASRLTFARAGTNMALTRDRVLYQAGDWIEFAWNRNRGKWTDVAGYASEQLEGSATIDAASIANGAMATAGTIAVTGAAVGDRVATVTAGIVTGGLNLWGEVTAADTVTVYARNDTGGAVDLASTAWRAQVMRV